MNKICHTPSDFLASVDYEHDFVQWIDKQVELLRAKDFEQLDLEHLIEEMDDMGRSLKRELGSRLEVLILHLLKSQFQPQHRSTAWLGTIGEQRSRILRRLRESPSLGKLVEAYAVESYPFAIKRASIDTGLAVTSFPPALPYTVEQLLDFDFIP